MTRIEKYIDFALRRDSKRLNATHFFFATFKAQVTNGVLFLNGTQTDSLEAVKCNSPVLCDKLHGWSKI